MHLMKIYLRQMGAFQGKFYFRRKNWILHNDINTWRSRRKFTSICNLLWTEPKNKLTWTSLVVSGWEPICQRRGHKFDRCSGTVPHAVEQISPCATTMGPSAATTEAPSLQLLRPLMQLLRPPHCNYWGPLTATAEAPSLQLLRPPHATTEGPSLQLLQSVYLEPLLSHLEKAHT